MFRLFKKKKPVEETKSEQIDKLSEQETKQSIELQSTDSLIDSNVDSELNIETIDVEIDQDANFSTPVVDDTEVLQQNQHETENLEQVLEQTVAEKVPEQQQVSEGILEDNLQGNPQDKVAEKNEVSISEEVTLEVTETPKETPKKEGLFDRLRSGLSKTGSTLTEGMGALVLGKKKIDDDVLEELETRLLMSDVGIEATQRIIQDLTNRTSRNELSDYDALMAALYEEMVKILRPVAKPLDVDDIEGPAVILLVGINGAGKTTTIGKLAKQLQNEGKSVMLAAGDTFRAAAVEQLQVWGERNDIPVIAQGTGSDSASII